MNTEWISNPPLLVVIGVAAAGVLLLFYAVTQALKKLLKLGLLLVVAAAVWFGIGRFVESGPEKVVRETKELAAAAERGDWTAFSKRLDPKVKFAIFGDRETLTKGIKASIGNEGVKNIELNDFETKEEPGGYVVTFAAYADIGSISQRAPTNWKFFWAKDDASGGYLLYRIEALDTGRFGAETVLSRLIK